MEPPARNLRFNDMREESYTRDDSYKQTHLEVFERSVNLPIPRLQRLKTLIRLGSLIDESEWRRSEAYRLDAEREYELAQHEPIPWDSSELYYGELAEVRVDLDQWRAAQYGVDEDGAEDEATDLVEMEAGTAASSSNDMVSSKLQSGNDLN